MQIKDDVHKFLFLCLPLSINLPKTVKQCPWGLSLVVEYVFLGHLMELLRKTRQSEESCKERKQDFEIDICLWYCTMMSLITTRGFYARLAVRATSESTWRKMIFAVGIAIWCHSLPCKIWCKRRQPKSAISEQRRNALKMMRREVQHCMLRIARFLRWTLCMAGISQNTYKSSTENAHFSMFCWQKQTQSCSFLACFTRVNVCLGTAAHLSGFTLRRKFEHIRRISGLHMQAYVLDA